MDVLQELEQDFTRDQLYTGHAVGQSFYSVIRRESRLTARLFLS